MRLIHTFAVAGLLLVGCQTQTEKQLPNSTTLLPPEVPARTQVQPAPQPRKGIAFDTDDCAAHMHTLAGQLILYYFKFQKLPSQLAELNSIADPGEDVPTSCPVSHQPYIYNPSGLIFGNDMRRLIVYDAAPSHGGTRWGVIFGQAKGREPVNMVVIQIPEPSMVGYRPAPELPQQPSQVQQQQSSTPQSIDQLSPELREKVLEQQRLLRKEIDAHRQQQQDPQSPVQPSGQPQNGPQQQQ